ncbi:MAG: hypothetical protein KF819_01400 [Labilithrix sp.]|nr:hypothetical protein [Labilithrix sp.]
MTKRALAAIAAVASLVACPGPGRDVVPETHDVHVTNGDASAADASHDAYVYVTRRPRAAIGLVGAHDMADDEARRIVDRVADELETCAARVEQRGALAHGAAQLVIVAGPRGNAEISDMRLEPGGPVAANALECIVAPLRATPMTPSSGPRPPALAIEATWGPIRGHAPPGGDAGPRDGL